MGLLRNKITRLFNYNAAQPSEGLKAAWNLSTVNDSFGTNHLTNVGVVTFTAGKVGNAATFTGANYLTIADNANLSVGAGKKLTICGWFKIPTLPPPAAVYGVVSKWFNPAGFEYLIDLTEDGQFRFLVSSTGAAGGIVVHTTGAGIIAANVWYFFTCWYDGVKLYIELNNSGTIYTTAFSASVFDGAAPVRIGNDADSTRLFTGQIDAVRLYISDNRVLTAAERSGLYNLGKGREFVSNNVVTADEVNREFDQIINLLNGITNDTTPAIVVSNSGPAVIVNQNGTGPIAQFYNGSTLRSEVLNNGTFKSYLATGTAPFIFGGNPNNLIDNLNVDLVDGKNASEILQTTSLITFCDSCFFDNTPIVGDRRIIVCEGNTLILAKIQQRAGASSDATILVTFKLDIAAETTIGTIVIAGNTQAVQTSDLADISLDDPSIVQGIFRVIAEITSIGGAIPYSDITVSLITKQLPI